MEYPEAFVDESGVLHDSAALAVVKAIEKRNCCILFDGNRDRIAHFRERAQALGKTAADVAIVLINVDDHNGRMMADILMPGADWQQFRDRGELPIARGLASHKFVYDALKIFDADAADKLWSGCVSSPDGPVAVVVVDRGVAEVYLGG